MTTFYFAYGSNMDEEQMSFRCPTAEFVGSAVLKGYAFIINNRGLATIVPKKDTVTPGIVWTLDRESESALDRYEGYRMGLYDKCFRIVRDDAGNKLDVLVYIDHINTSLGASQQGYLDKIIRAADDHFLSKKYLEMLRMWPEKSSFRSFNRLVNTVKSGKNFPDKVGRHGDDLSRLLKRSRDKLMLETLYQEDEWDAEEGFDVLLEQNALDKVNEAVEDYELNRAGELFIEYTSLSRFICHVDFLKEKEDFIDELIQSERYGEIGTNGVIITNDPAHLPHPEHHVVITDKAPALASLWRCLFSSENGVSPRICRFINIFAEIAETSEKDTLQHVVRRILLQVREEASNKQKALLREGDSCRD